MENITKYKERYYSNCYCYISLQFMQTSNESQVEVDIGKLLTNVEAWVTFVLLKSMPLTRGPTNKMNFEKVMLQ